MALIRDRLLPPVRLHECFHIPDARQDPAEALLILCECEGKEFCLLVDDLMGKQEVVIKSLGEMMKDVPGIAGGAILGDGRVGLILDVEAIFRG
jgi:two-component system chemotaxis sensor kinase CheA